MRWPSGWLGILLVGGLAAEAGLASPPGEVAMSGASPFAECGLDDPAGQPGTVSVGSEVEPWVAVNPRNPNHFVASWQQDRWSTGGARGLVAGVSFDRGRSWERVVLPGLTPCSGGSDFLRASDPWVTFAANGDVLHASLVVDRDLLDLLLGASDHGRSAMVVHRSTDGGLSWTGPFPVVDEDFAGLHDKQAVTADPHDPNVAYVVWDRLDFVAGGGPALASTTRDGGITWSAPSVVHDPGPEGQTVASQLVVLPDGTLVDFFTDIEVLDVPPFERDRLGLKRSRDGGATWEPAGAPIIAASIEPSFDLASPDDGQPIRGGEGLFDVAVDARTGALYAVWQDGRFNGFGHEAVAFTASFDGGLHWSAPIQVNATPRDLPSREQQAFVPSVAVAADGSVGVTYYDFRANGDEPEALADFWAVSCKPRGRRDCTRDADWGPEVRLTEASFDLDPAPVAGGLFLGDYAGLAASARHLVAVYAVSSAEDPASLRARVFGLRR